MRKYTKIITGALSIFAMTLFVRMPVQADSTIHIKQTACTKDSVTLAWTNPNHLLVNDDSTEETTVSRYVLKTGDNRYTKTLDGDETSTVMKLPRSYTGTVKITATYKIQYKDKADSRTETKTCQSSTTINTSPPVPQKTQFSISKMDFAKNSIIFSTKKTNANYKIHLQLYKGNTLVGDYKNYTTSTTVPFSYDTVYRYRIKYSYKNTGNGKTYESSNWSSFRYFDQASLDGHSSSKKKGLTLIFKKVAGVTEYKVYLSKYHSKGYHKAATVKLGSKTTVSERIKKGYRSNQTNYILVIPVISRYGQSDTYTTGSIHVYK